MQAQKAEPMLEIMDLHSYYGSIQALHGVSLVVNKGEIVTLIGSNGAGKSTLLMTIFGNPLARSGKIRYLQEDITKVDTFKVAEKGIALVPEGRRIFSSMTVEENLKMGTISIGDTYMDEDLNKVYGLFPRLKERHFQRAGTLSGGEQQMLAIGRGLMARPKLLLLDEPSLGLAPIIVKQIFNIIKEIAQQGITIFLVEQNANHALRLANRAYVLVNGEIRLSGTGEELRNDPEVQKAYLGS
ncbi:MAG: ABC transporter ATP-binding protein [Bdellovibrionota bacterium]